MEAPLEFRPWRPGDEEAINRGFNQVFGLERSLAEWRWKFQRAGVPSPIMLAWSGDDLLAHYAGIPARFAVDGEIFRAAQIVDVYSTRRARRLFARRGIYVRTVEAFFREFGESRCFPLLYGFPGRRALRLGVLELGYDAMEPEPIWVMERVAGEGRRPWRRYPYTAEAVSPQDPRFDELWQRVSGRYPVAVVRDRRRVVQRLAGHPAVEYRLFMITPRLSHRPVAWVAFRSGPDALRWMDLVWDGQHPGALELAAHLGRLLAEAAGAPRETMWLVGDPEAAEVLARLGYRRRREPDGLVMVARSFPGGPDLERVGGRVYLTLADSDLA